MDYNKINSIVDFKFEKHILQVGWITIGDRKIPVTKKIDSVKVKIDFNKDVDWLFDNDNLCVTIGDTMYNKSLSDFHFDYFNNSYDWLENLKTMVDEGEIYIYECV